MTAVIVGLQTGAQNVVNYLSHVGGTAIEGAQTVLYTAGEAIGRSVLSLFGI